MKAFPRPIGPTDSCFTAPPQEGMDLRDYFAGQIMSGTDWGEVSVATFSEESLDRMAQQAYRIADAMMRVRGEEK